MHIYADVCIFISGSVNLSVISYIHIYVGDDLLTSITNSIIYAAAHVAVPVPVMCALRCGLCRHTPTRVGQMGWTIWAVQMWWYTMVSSCHTYCSPCGHAGVCSVPLYTLHPMWSSQIPIYIFISVAAFYTHCGPCGHPRCSCINTHSIPCVHIRIAW